MIFSIVKKARTKKTETAKDEKYYIHIDVFRSYIFRDKDFKFSKKYVGPRKNIATSVVTIEQLLDEIKKKKVKIDLLKSIKKLKKLTLLPLTEKVLEEAVKISKKYKLPLYNAIHFSTCSVNKMKMIVLDKKLAKLKIVESETPY